MEAGVDLAGVDQALQVGPIGGLCHHHDIVGLEAGHHVSETFGHRPLVLDGQPQLECGRIIGPRPMSHSRSKQAPRARPRP